MLGHWPSGLQIGFPNLIVSFFSALGPIQGLRVQHLLVTWGQIEKIFSISALTPNIKPLGADFNFCTNTNA
jgi:hypothetical protein